MVPLFNRKLVVLPKHRAIVFWRSILKFRNVFTVLASILCFVGHLFWTPLQASIFGWSAVTCANEPIKSNRESGLLLLDKLQAARLRFHEFSDRITLRLANCRIFKDQKQKWSRTSQVRPSDASHNQSLHPNFHTHPDALVFTCFASTWGFELRGFMEDRAKPIQNIQTTLETH